MHFSQLFRSLKPDQLTLVVGEFGNDPGYYDGLIEHEAPGLMARVSPKGRVASLKAEIHNGSDTNAASLKGKIAKSKEKNHIEEAPQWADSKETNVQRDGFTACLMYFQLPFTPDATFKAVGESLDPILPRILTTGVESGYRQVAGLTDEGIAVSCVFKNNRLLSFEITDLVLTIICDRFRRTPEALISSERENALKHLKLNPEVAFFQYIGDFDGETIEWSRGLSPAVPEPEVDEEEMMAQMERRFSENDTASEEEELSEEWLPS